MLKEIEFQGHVFTLREDGLYECHDDFEFDEKDWNYGYNYIQKMILTRYQNGKEIPWLMHDSSQGSREEEEIRFKHFLVENQKNDGRAHLAPSVPMEGLLL